MERVAARDFERIELRVGTIIRVDDLTDATRPAYKMLIDFGEFGIKKSSAQITKLYDKEDLLGQQVVCVMNLPPVQVASFVSEVLATGFALANGDVVLAQPEKEVPNGTRLN